MLLRPWLLFSRGRLLTAAIASICAACVAYMWVSADGLLDFGIFWHSFCGCPVDPQDAYFLLNVPALTALVVGLIFGFPAVYGVTASVVPGGAMKASSRFFFTRPVSRRVMFLAPHAIATGAIVLFPALAFLLLIEWLHLVHAPALHHVMASLRTVPALSSVGPHPTFVEILKALGAPRRYLAAISVGLCGYAIYSSMQTLLISPSKKVNLLAVLPILMPFVPVFIYIVGSPMSVAMFLAPGHGTPLTYLPSTLGIALHFLIAVAVFLGCWRIVWKVEL